MLDYQKYLRFLVSDFKLISEQISPTAQWDRIGTVAVPFNTTGIDPSRHQTLFSCWIIKKTWGFVSSIVETSLKYDHLALGQS